MNQYVIIASIMAHRNSHMIHSDEFWSKQIENNNWFDNSFVIHQIANLAFLLRQNIHATIAGKKKQKQNGSTIFAMWLKYFWESTKAELNPGNEYLVNELQLLIYYI